MYRVINDNLEVSKRTFDLLVSGLYPEELLGQSTADLIMETPVLIKVEEGAGKLKIAAAVTIVVAMAAAAFFFLKKKQ